MKFSDLIPSKKKAVYIFASAAVLASITTATLPTYYDDVQPAKHLQIDFSKTQIDLGGGICVPFAFWGNRYVANIQAGTIALGNSVGSASLTISNSPIAMTGKIFNGHTTNATTDNNDRTSPKISQNTDTSITASRGFASADTVTVNFCAILYNPILVESVTSGSLSVTASSSGTVTIGSIDQNRTGLFYLGNTGTDSGTSVPRRYAIRFTSATQITANSNSSTTASVGFCAVQYRQRYLQQNVQPFNFTSVTSLAVDSIPISSVVMANSFIAYAGNLSGGTGNYALQLTGSGTSTNIQATRTTTGTASRTVRGHVIEFVAGVFRSVQRATQSLVGVSGLIAFISEVDNSKAFANFTGWSFTSTDTANKRYSSISFTGGVVGVDGEPGTSDGLVVDTGTSTTSARGVAYEVPEFM